MSDTPKTKVFISYSRKNKLFVRKLNTALDAAGVDAWVDWEGIPLSADWMATIQAAIEGADAFIFVISPDSLKSEVCAKELEIAVNTNKKVVPVLYGMPDRRQKMHPKLSSTNWVYLRPQKDNFKDVIPKLVETLHTDLGWVQQHTRLLLRCVEWDQKQRNNSYLLQGTDLDEAERWMTESTRDANRAATPLQAEYITASRKNAIRRQRNLTMLVGAAMLISIALFVVALFQWKSSNENANEAAQSAAVAATNAAIADANAQEAKLQQKRAEENQSAAEAQRSAAQANAYSERPGERDTSMLLAIDSMQRTPSIEAEDVLRNNIVRMPIPVAQLKQDGWVFGITTSKEGKYIVSFSADNTACVSTIDGEKKYCVQHDDDVTDAIITADNSLLITSSKDNTVRFWNFADGAPLDVFKYESKVLDIDLNQQNTYVIAGREDGQVSLISVDTRRVLYTFNFANGPVSVVKFRADGNWITIGTKEGRVRLWKVMTSLLESGPRHNGEIFNILISPNEKLALSVSADSTARISRAETGRETHIMNHTDWVEDAAFSPDSSWFVTVSDDKIVRVFDSETGIEKIRMYHGSFVQKVEVSPDGKWIASTGYDHTLRIWDSQTGALMLEASLEGIGSALVFSPDGNRVIAGDRDGNLTIWDIASLDTRVGFISFPEYVNKAKFDPAGNWILFNTDDLSLWQIPTSEIANITDGTLGTQLLKFDELTSQMKISPDSKWVALSINSEQNNSRTILYNIETKEEVTLQHGSDVTTLAISSDSKQIATTNTGSSAVAIWDIQTGELITNVLFDETAYTSAYSPKDPILAVGLTDKIILWNMETNSQAAVLSHPGKMRSVIFNQDGSLLATANFDGDIFIWDMSTTTPIEPKFKFFQDSTITSMEFNPARPWLATAGTDSYVYIWDVTTGSEVIRIPHSDTVSGVNFSPDGALLATVSRKTVQFWDTNQFVPITKDKLIEIACSRLTRNFVLDEWTYFFGDEPYRKLCPKLP